MHIASEVLGHVDKCHIFSIDVSIERLLRHLDPWIYRLCRMYLILQHLQTFGNSGKVACCDAVLDEDCKYLCKVIDAKDCDCFLIRLFFEEWMVRVKYSKDSGFCFMNDNRNQENRLTVVIKRGEMLNHSTTVECDTTGELSIVF